MMKKNVLTIGMAMGASLLMCAPVLAADAAVTPSTNRMYIHEGENKDIVEEIPAYVYRDNNYFKLRDVGKLLGYDVTWNESEKCIEMQKDASKKGPVSSEFLKDPVMTNQKQNIQIDGTAHKDVSCININGYNYFKLRNLASLMDFTCEWDYYNEAVVVVLPTSEAPKGIDSALEKIAAENTGLQEMNESAVTYLPGSKGYQNIEKYIYEVIDGRFKAGDYTATEKTEGDITVVDLMYHDADKPDLKFGYRVYCANNRAQLIGFIGEKNGKYDTSNIQLPVMDKEELAKRAIEADGYFEEGGKFKVDENRFRQYFDVNALTFKCEVDTVYQDSAGCYFAHGHTFEL